MVKPDLGSGGAILRGSSPLPGKYLEIRELRNCYNALMDVFFQFTALLLPFGEIRTSRGGY